MELMRDKILNIIKAEICTQGIDHSEEVEAAKMLSQMFCDFHIDYAQRMNAVAGVDQEFFIENINPTWFPAFTQEELNKAVEKIR